MTENKISPKEFLLMTYSVEVKCYSVNEQQGGENFIESNRPDTHAIPASHDWKDCG